MHKRISRRAALRGVGGTAIALPFLEAMLPGSAQAEEKPPLRYIVCFVGQGLAAGDSNVNYVVPDKVGAMYDLKAGLLPLADVRDRVTIVSGMRIPPPNGSTVDAGGYADAGLHDSTMSPLLSGVRSLNANGKCRGATSDQVVASAWAASGKSALHYRVQASVYAENFFNNRDGVSKGQMSYKADAAGKVVGVPPVSSPHLAFQLFAGIAPGDPQAAARNALLVGQRKSVLDLVAQRTERLMGHLGRADQSRLTQHLDEIRALERRIEALPDPGAASSCHPPQEPTDPPLGGARADERPESGYSTNNGYSDEETRAAVLTDLLALALSCDLARVVTLMYTMPQCFMNAYPLLGYRDDFHNLSHHFDSAAVAKGIAWHTKHFAALVSRLSSLTENGGSILDHSAIVCLFEAGGKAAHSGDQMACLVAGKAGGLIPGQHLRAPDHHPAEVLLSAMNAVGVPTDALGEVKGTIPGLRA